MNKYKAEAALLITTLIWGGTFVIIKAALDDISPLMFISIRFSIAALFLIFIFYNHLKKIKGNLLKDGLFLGFFFFIGFAAQSIGLNYTTATKSAFITGTFVIFTPFFQLLIEKRPPKKEIYLAIFLVVIGLILLSSKGTSLLEILSELGTNFNAGDFLTLICAISFALYIVYLDIISKKHDYQPLVFIQIAFTAAAGFLFALIFDSTGVEKITISFSDDVILAFVYTAILATIVTTSLQTKYQKVVTPSKAGIILSFEPLFAAMFAFVLLGERLSSFGIIGCIFIFTGLLTSEILGSKRKEYE